MALNNAGIRDEAGSYEDWIEIYNPGPDAVDMTGLFLTDDLTLTTQWAFPDTTLAAGGFLLVWCDNDPEDGPLHAIFKLSGSGESIGLFGRLSAGNQAIDSVTFGAQTSNVSEGRDHGRRGRLDHLHRADSRRHATAQPRASPRSSRACCACCPTTRTPSIR